MKLFYLIMGFLFSLNAFSSEEKRYIFCADVLGNWEWLKDKGEYVSYYGESKNINLFKMNSHVTIFIAKNLNDKMAEHREKCKSLNKYYVFVQAAKSRNTTWDLIASEDKIYTGIFDYSGYDKNKKPYISRTANITDMTYQEFFKFFKD